MDLARRDAKGTPKASPPRALFVRRLTEQLDELAQPMLADGARVVPAVAAFARDPAWKRARRDVILVTQGPERLELARIRRFSRPSLGDADIDQLAAVLASALVSGREHHVSPGGARPVFDEREVHVRRILAVPHGSELAELVVLGFVLPERLEAFGHAPGTSALVASIDVRAVRAVAVRPAR